jgi:hypothetical protein
MICVLAFLVILGTNHYLNFKIEQQIKKNYSLNHLLSNRTHSNHQKNLVQTVTFIQQLNAQQSLFSALLQWMLHQSTQVPFRKIQINQKNLILYINKKLSKQVAYLKKHLKAAACPYKTEHESAQFDENTKFIITIRSHSPQQKTLGQLRQEAYRLTQLPTNSTKQTIEDFFSNKLFLKKFIEHTHNLAFKNEIHAKRYLTKLCQHHQFKIRSIKSKNIRLHSSLPILKIHLIMAGNLYQLRQLLLQLKHMHYWIALKNLTIKALKQKTFLFEANFICLIIDRIDL